MKEQWRFGVVGNIIHEHLDENGTTLYGTKAFSGGTKVYIDGRNWSNYPRTEITVLGMNRFKKWQLVQVSPELIENVRFQLIRKKTVLEILDYEERMEGWSWWGRLAADKREAKEFAENWEHIKEKAIFDAEYKTT